MVEVARAVARLPSVRTLGGRRAGGELNEAFTGEAWIEAGGFAYKVRVEEEGVGKEKKKLVRFQRFDKKGGKEEGSVYSFALGDPFKVGSEKSPVNNYVLTRDLDSLLSGRHFSLKVTEEEEEGRSVLRLHVEDLKSSNGTTVTWITPTLDARKELERDIARANTPEEYREATRKYVKRVVPGASDYEIDMSFRLVATRGGLNGIEIIVQNDPILKAILEGDA